MSIIAIFVGGLPPSLSDIPPGCWAEKNAAHEAWAVVGDSASGQYGAVAAINIVAGEVSYWYDGDWHPYPKGDKITVAK